MTSLPGTKQAHSKAHTLLRVCALPLWLPQCKQSGAGGHRCGDGSIGPARFLAQHPVHCTLQQQVWGQNLQVDQSSAECTHTLARGGYGGGCDGGLN
jgi:hypothetical protein